jgi:hypothetical protein
VVKDDGIAPLSNGQVWGLNQLVAPAMIVYDISPKTWPKGSEHSRRGRNNTRSKRGSPQMEQEELTFTATAKTTNGSKDYRYKA